MTDPDQTPDGFIKADSQYELEVIYALKRISNSLEVLQYQIEQINARLGRDDKLLLKSKESVYVSSTNHNQKYIPYFDGKEDQ